MELPDLGRHCGLTDCKRLDFLPIKCNGCNVVFCSDHFRYEHHDCPKKGILDRQVPACPLCSKPGTVWPLRLLTRYNCRYLTQHFHFTLVQRFLITFDYWMSNSVMWILWSFPRGHHMVMTVIVPLGKDDKPLDQIVNEHIERNCDSEMAARKRAKRKEGRFHTKVRS